MNKYMRQDLLSFKPYHSPLKPYDIKMDANESPFPHPESFSQYMSQFSNDSENITRYPDTDSTELREKIAMVYDLIPENILCGVGSDQVIDMVIRTFVNPQDKVIMPTPSFSMYKLSTIINHGQVIEIPLDDMFEYEIETYIQTIKDEKPALVFLCTPNNPTGCVLDRDTVIKVIEACDCPIVVDEAYAEFTDISVVDLINTYEHMIVLRTFSKAFGLAGLRTGYAVACQEMISTLNVTKPPYNLSTIAQAASVYVLNHYDYYMDLVKVISIERERLSTELRKLSFVTEVYKSGTNFVLIKLNRSGIAKLLEEQLILIRDYPPTGDLASCARITVGTQEEDDRLLTILKQI